LAITYHPSKLHLYGKDSAKPGRKMGHVTFTAPTIEQALEYMTTIKQAYQIEV